MHARSVPLSIVCAAVMAAQVLAQEPTTLKAPCPPPTPQKGLMGEKGKAGYEPQSKQPQEKSAILPSAPQNDQSAAPTVQQDGSSVLGETTCERDPNKARS